VVDNEEGDSEEERGGKRGRTIDMTALVAGLVV